MITIIIHIQNMPSHVTCGGTFLKKITKRRRWDRGWNENAVCFMSSVLNEIKMHIFSLDDSCQDEEKCRQLERKVSLNFILSEVVCETSGDRQQNRQKSQKKILQLSVLPFCLVESFFVKCIRNWVDLYEWDLLYILLVQMCTLLNSLKILDLEWGWFDIKWISSRMKKVSGIFQTAKKLRVRINKKKGGVDVWCMK